MLRAIPWLLLAAFLEVGGDALVRWGIRGGHLIGFVAGAIVLFLYGLSVNLPKWDFGRLMGVYISLFFLVSQIFSIYIFREKWAWPQIIGGFLKQCQLVI